MSEENMNNSDNVIQYKEEQQVEMERLVAAFMRGDIDASTLNKKLKEFSIGINLRRAATQLKTPIWE